MCVGSALECTVVSVPPPKRTRVCISGSACECACALGVHSNAWW